MKTFSDIKTTVDGLKGAVNSVANVPGAVANAVPKISIPGIV
jgi:hypothetical protein